ncbi:hypothetical protein LC55x_3824 [Lysobacter capsici]|nr:hypothetical protein LC55x_3824 [Lysobacter capsici]
MLLPSLLPPSPSLSPSPSSPQLYLLLLAPHVAFHSQRCEACNSR